MAEITAVLVKGLRDKTGVGMMDCKKALVETAGDVEAAAEWLRAKGVANAARKAERVAAEGLVGLAVEGTSGALVELNAETDFVARNPAFQQAATAFAAIALAVRGDHERLLKAASPDGDGRVADLVTRMTATIGEHINLRRCAFLSSAQGVLASYVHGTAGPGLGRIGVLVAIESSGPVDAVGQFGRKIAMHIAASTPLWVSINDVPSDVVAAKRAELTEQAVATGKPPQVLEKMIAGRIQKFYDQVVLTRQAFVLNLEQTVEEALREAEQSIGAAITIKRFARLRTGEGLDSSTNPRR